MQEFILLLRGDGMNHCSPTELQSIMADYSTWVKDLGEHYIGGQRLEDNGALIGTKTSEVLTDGPFLESKEIIAGFFMIQAESQEAANKMALSSPHLGLYTIEVRPIVYPKMV